MTFLNKYIVCGINGFNFKDAELIGKMNTKNAHRGPDGNGIYIDEGISLGHNRLAIIDLSDKASQPMHDEIKRFTVIFNGEIYNYKELRGNLIKKYNFFSDSDTEVILRLFQEYDVECFRRLNGIFAIAIWDAQEKRLILARDFVGIKPLYYFYNNRKFIFSSEIKSILEHHIERYVDEEAMRLYFTLLYVPEPLTMFGGIKKFPAGNYAILQKDNLIFESFREVAFNRYSFSCRHEAAEAVGAIFHDSIKRQLISDKPLGVFLSGGIDSSAVLAEAARISGERVKTFSVSFKVDEQQEKFNQDSILAKKTAEYFATDHLNFEVSANDIKDVIDKMVWHMDEPNSNPTAAIIYLLSRETKKKVDVVLGGDGGDELFGGYPRYYYANYISRYRSFPDFIQSAGLYILKFIGQNKIVEKFRSKNNSDIILNFLGQPAEILSSIMKKDFIVDGRAQSVFENLLDHCPDNDFALKFMYCDLRSWLKDESLARSDKMTMAHGLEQRVPILDNEMLDIAFNIPSRWKLKNSRQGKSIWIEAVRDLIPGYLLYQPKRGWFSPMAKWLRKELKDIAMDHIGQLNKDYFNNDVAKKILVDHIEKRKYNLPLIWAMIAWQGWYNVYISRRS